MTELLTLVVDSPCPECGHAEPRAAVVARPPRPRLAGQAPAWPDGRYAARISTCDSCWALRARALQSARERLAASGVLGRAPSGRPTWQGAELRDRDGGRDELEVALASELLRRGLAAPWGSGNATLELRAGLARCVAVRRRARA